MFSLHRLGIWDMRFVEALIRAVENSVVVPQHASPPRIGGGIRRGGGMRTLAFMPGLPGEPAIIVGLLVRVELMLEFIRWGEKMGMLTKLLLLQRGVRPTITKITKPHRFEVHLTIRTAVAINSVMLLTIEMPRNGNTSLEPRVLLPLQQRRYLLFTHLSGVL